MRSWMQALGAAASPLQPVSALDIEELLDERPWEQRFLDEDERQLLQGALEFLDKVKTGGDIILQVARHGTVVPDVLSLDAYEYTRRALQSSVLFPEMTFEERRDIIEQACKIIEVILKQGDELDFASLGDTAPARRLFWTLAKYSHSRGSVLQVM